MGGTQHERTRETEGTMAIKTDEATKNDEASRSTRAVTHLSVEERVKLGKEARARVPRSSHAGIQPCSRPPGPCQPARASGHHPGAGAGPHPLRAHAGVPVHLLPGCSAHHGLRPGHHPSVRPEGPGLRGCPPVQLRPVRLARAGHDVRRQRLRRDPSRALGVGRQAPGRQRGHRRPGPASSPRRRPAPRPSRSEPAIAPR